MNLHGLLAEKNKKRVDASTFQLLTSGCCYQISTPAVVEAAEAEVVEAAEAAEAAEERTSAPAAPTSATTTAAAAAPAPTATCECLVGCD
jgi:hypothetical protein